MVNRNEILEYVATNYYHTKPEYLWQKYPDYAVLRHHDNHKWYAILMNIPKEKLGLQGKEELTIIDIKVYSDMIGSLQKKEGVFPAYHMNKEYWISISLDSSFPKQELFELLDLSFQITK